MKLCKKLEPGKSFIAWHAFAHAELCLYYLLPATERDKKFYEQRPYETLGKVVWGERKFRRIIKWLIEHSHKELNRVLKGIVVAPCKAETDACVSVHNTVVTYFEVKGHYRHWRIVNSAIEYDRLTAAGAVGRIRKVITQQQSHNLNICKNRLLATRLEDYVGISKWLSHEGKVYDVDFEGMSSRAKILREIRILVRKYDLT